ncbi:MAG: hypothetical protein WAU88_00195 [Candidatus Zixiibacteriota bacterium]
MTGYEDRIKALIDLDESQSLILLGARLQGFESFEAGLGISKGDMKNLLVETSEQLSNRQALAIVSGPFRNAYDHMISFSNKCLQEASDFMDQRRQELFDLICIKFDYCAKSKKYSSQIELLAALAVFLESFWKEAPVIEIVVAMAKSGLDSFCMCS